MDDCKIVTDLLPSYCDELTSWETNTYIRTHLNTCPGCSKQLQQMQHRREPNEADIRRANFKAALEVYELNYRVRVCLIALVCFVLVAAFFIVRACSFDIAISAADLSSKHLTVIQEPTHNSEGKLYQVVASRSKNGNAALAFLTKNFLGFWTVSSVDVADPSRGYDHALMFWSDISVNFYSMDSDFQHDNHIVYSNTNAIKLIEFPQEVFDGGTVVYVWQNAEHYWIHIATTEGFSEDIPSLLKEYGFTS
jgi:hypothetical protein